jgi:hypothetical protein
MTGTGRDGTAKQRLSHFNQPSTEKIFEERQQIALASFRFDVIFLQQNLVNIRDLARRMQQFPYLRSDWVKSVVNAPFRVQDSCFRTKTTRHLVLCDGDYGFPGKAHYSSLWRYSLWPAGAKKTPRMEPRGLVNYGFLGTRLTSSSDWAAAYSPWYRFPNPSPSALPGPASPEPPKAHSDRVRSLFDRPPESQAALRVPSCRPLA